MRPIGEAVVLKCNVEKRPHDEWNSIREFNSHLSFSRESTLDSPRVPKKNLKSSPIYDFQFETTKNDSFTRVKFHNTHTPSFIHTSQAGWTVANSKYELFFLIAPLCFSVYFEANSRISWARSVDTAWNVNRTWSAHTHSRSSLTDVYLYSARHSGHRMRSNVFIWLRLDVYTTQSQQQQQ